MFEYLWQLDRDLFRTIHFELNRGWLDGWFKVITDTGLGHFQLLGLILFFFWRPARPYVILGFYSGIVGGAIRLIIGHFMWRQRPSNYDFATPIEEVYVAPSFPSGHTTTAWAIAIAVAWALKGTDRAWIGWVLGVWAALVGVSRIYVGVHYPVDVIGGALLGTIVATVMYVWLWPRITKRFVDAEALQEKAEAADGVIDSVGSHDGTPEMGSEKL